jgi:hypothetical protein
MIFSALKASSLVQWHGASHMPEGTTEPILPFRVRSIGLAPENGGTDMSKPKVTQFNVPRVALLLTALCMMPGGAVIAATSSPFAAMAGSWSGGGVLSTTDGTQERLRCRASYDVAGSGAALRLNLKCASQSYNFDLASDVQYRGGAISGSWSEASQNASGSISGRAVGDRIEAAARGQTLSVNLSMTTRGGRQSVSIRPQGTNVTAVSLELDRR